MVWLGCSEGEIEESVSKENSNNKEDNATESENKDKLLKEGDYVLKIDSFD